MGVTLHGNCHSLAARLSDILLLVKHIIEDTLFYEQFGRRGMWNHAQESAFPDLFAESKALLSTSIELARYVSFPYGNWDNYDSNESNDDNVAAGVNKNDDDENMGGPPDNSYKLYGMYN